MYIDIINTTADIVRNVALEKFAQLENKNITQKKDGSFVTDFDIAIDTQLTQELKRAFPSISFISEESQADTSMVTGLAWCIDPIDGTHNFMNDIPYYAISVGLLKDGEPVAGIIYDSISDDLLIGGENIPVCLNGEVLEVKNTSRIVVTGRSHSQDDKIKEANIVSIILKSENIKYRRFASCALDIMNMVRGRIGAVIVIGNSKWDWSAGYAIAKKAEHIIQHIDENHFVISNNNLTEIFSMIK